MSDGTGKKGSDLGNVLKKVTEKISALFQRNFVKPNNVLTNTTV
jgi:hypothetical protein